MEVDQDLLIAFYVTLHSNGLTFYRGCYPYTPTFRAQAMLAFAQNVINCFSESFPRSEAIYGLPSFKLPRIIFTESYDIPV